MKPKEEYVDPWPCKPERWKQYLLREVELAVQNIRLTGSSELSSAETVKKALQQVNGGGQ